MFIAINSVLCYPVLLHSQYTTGMQNWFDLNNKNLATLTIWSLFNLLAVPGPHLLSLCNTRLVIHFINRLYKQNGSWSVVVHHSFTLSLSRPPTVSSLKITDRSFRYASGINSLIHSVSLASHVLTYFLIHLSAHLYYHHHSCRPSLLHSFTPGS